MAKRPSKKRVTRQKTYAQLKKELDRVFSIWVRKRHSDNEGVCECVTCGFKAPWPKLQAGHFITRSRLSTRWERLNVWPQCVQCNIHKKGNYPAYAAFLIKMCGTEILQDLIEYSQKPTKLTRADLQALIVRYSDPLPESRIGQPEQSSG